MKALLLTLVLLQLLSTGVCDESGQKGTIKKPTSQHFLIEMLEDEGFFDALRQSVREMVRAELIEQGLPLITQAQSLPPPRYRTRSRYPPGPWNRPRSLGGRYYNRPNRRLPMYSSEYEVIEIPDGKSDVLVIDSDVE